MSFSHSQGAVGSVNPGTTFNIVLTNNPANGNVVAVGLAFNTASISSLTVKDSANNSYTKATNAPYTSSAGNAYLFYLIAGGTATKTITVSWTTSAICAGWADEFTVTGGTATFDKDTGGSQTSSGGGAITTPSITPTNGGSLLYAIADLIGSVGGITSPTAGGTAGLWTGAAGAITLGSMAEYDLSVTGAQAVNFTDSSGSDTCCVGVMALFIPVPDIYYPEDMTPGTNVIFEIA